MNRVREFAVDPRDAAGMFSLNWETLREHAAVAARTTASERDALAEALAALRDGSAQASPIAWGLRQVRVRGVTPCRAESAACSLRSGGSAAA